MSSSITISSTLDAVYPFIRYAPLVIGASSQPALGIASEVRDTILNVPMAWPWNRARTAFALASGTQDYTVALPSFGWLEQASITGADGKTFMIDNIKNVLTQDTTSARPTNVSPLIDDNAGNITFRFGPVPEQNYTANIIYQKVPVQFAATSDTWTPIPDRYYQIYVQGVKALAFIYTDDARWQVEYQRFLTSLAGINGGLSMAEKSSWVEAMLASKVQAMHAEGGKR